MINLIIKEIEKNFFFTLIKINKLIINIHLHKSLIMCALFSLFKVTNSNNMESTVCSLLDQSLICFTYNNVVSS